MIEIVWIILFTFFKHERDESRVSYKSTISWWLGSRVVDFYVEGWSRIPFLWKELQTSEAVRLKKDRHKMIYGRWLFENRYDTKSWWTKTVFAVVLDGWHFHESILVMLFSIALTWSMNVSLWWAVLIYAFIGGAHSLWDGSLLRYFKKNKE